MDQATMVPIAHSKPWSKEIVSKGKKLLIVEDEVSLSQPLRLKLTDAGYDVTVIGDGHAALQAITG